MNASSTLETTTLNISTSMFVPCVGYLFTCDLESTGRYCYYNNLERRRRVKTYKELTRVPGSGESEYEEESDDDENTDPTATTTGSDDSDDSPSKKSSNNLKPINQPTMSRSENDLLRSVALFLASVSANSTLRSLTNNKNRDVTRSKSSSSTLTSSYSTETDEEQDRDEDVDEDVVVPAHETVNKPSGGALPLQYNTLMAMLKSKSKVNVVPATPVTGSVNMMQKSNDSKRMNGNNNNNNLGVQINNKINLLLSEQQMHRKDSFSRNSKSKLNYLTTLISTS